MLPARSIALAFFLSLSSLVFGLEAWFEHKVFQTGDNETYVETYLSFTGTSLRHVEVEDSLWQASVSCVLLIKQGAEIVDFRKLNIEGPFNETGMRQDFLDVQRFLLTRGTYSFDIELKDLHNPDDSVTFQKDFEIGLAGSGLACSDIVLVKAFAQTQSPNELSKSGLDLLPYVSNYYPQSTDVMMFYAEIYGTDEAFGNDGKFLLDCFIRDRESGEIKDVARRIKRETAAEVVPVIQTLDISEVGSGGYEVVVEVRNRDNELMASSSIEILRSNRLEKPTAGDLSQIDPTLTFTASIEDPDTLQFYLDALSPIASAVELTTIQNLMQDADITTMQQYLYYFWARRDEGFAEALWNRYLKEIWKAESLFATRIKRAHETDMGRIYLKYGSPNSIGKRHQDIHAYPYEIWHYYELGDRFRNKRFVFWNQDLVGEEFFLLQSDVPGEISNAQWKSLILSRGDLTQQGGGDPSSKSSSLQILEDLYINP